MILIDDADVLVGEEASPDGGGSRHLKPRLNDQAKRRLSTHLRALYQSVLEQPVPDKFKDLITRLDDQVRD